MNIPYTFSPPDRGNIHPNSSQTNKPEKERSKPSSQSINAAPTLPTLSVTLEGVLKIPVPMIRPMLKLKPVTKKPKILSRLDITDIKLIWQKQASYIRNVVLQSPKCRPKHQQYLLQSSTHQVEQSHLPRVSLHCSCCRWNQSLHH